MSDNQESQPVEGAEILRVLRDIRAQVRSNGEQLTKCLTELQSLAVGQRNHTQTLAGIGEQLAAADQDRGALHGKVDGVAGEVARIGGVVDQAAPLLNSGPVRALGGGGVLQMIRGTRKSADG